jgi:predicted nucleic acid-binding protein
MKRIFADTSAWYAVAFEKAVDHAAATAFFRQNASALLTTNYIFDETVTLLGMKLGWTVAAEFGRRLKESTSLLWVNVTPQDEARAWEIFLQYDDQDFSFTDCVSFAVMQRLGIEAAFAFDEHFSTMRFQQVPSP